VHVASDFDPDDWPEPGTDDVSAGEGTAIVRALDLAKDPELHGRPSWIVERLAVRGRTTILSADPKTGKSTLLGDAAARLSNGEEFFGSSRPPADVLWLGLEEHPVDTLRRFIDFGADLARLHVVRSGAPDLLDQARRHLAAHPAELVVVDSLQEWARTTLGEAPGDGENHAWGSVVRPLVGLSREFGASVILLHHLRRSDGQTRGASEIQAAVDGVLEMHEAGGPTMRRIRGRARWRGEPFLVRLNRADRYVLAGGDGAGEEPRAGDDLPRRVLRAIQERPGLSTRAVRDAVVGRSADIRAALEELIKQGLVENVGSTSAAAFHPREGGSA